MLGHPHRHRGQVEHLPPLHIHLRRAYQVRAAASARTGLMPQPLVRIGDLPQRRTRMPGLPARLASTPTPQRPRRRLGKRRVRRRRLRRVLRVLPQPGGQLSNLSPQRLDHHPKLRVLGGKLLIGRTRISGHHTMVDNPARRSTSHAEDPTSHIRSRVRAVDDAAGGQRGTRAVVSADLEGFLRANWGVWPAGPAPDLGGSSNPNLLVTDGRSLQVARVYRPFVTGQRIAALQAVRQHLASHGVPAPSRSRRPAAAAGRPSRAGPWRSNHTWPRRPR